MIKIKILKILIFLVKILEMLFLIYNQNKNNNKIQFNKPKK